MTDMQRQVLMRRDGAMDRAGRGRMGGNRGGSRGGRSDGHYPYMPYRQMGRGGYQDYEMNDGRRGVKGSGRGRRRDRGEMPYDREIDYEREDYEMSDYGYDRNSDYGYDDYGYNDYGMDEMEEMRLTKHDMKKWKEKMVNADGTKGEHFTMEKIEPIAQKVGIRFNEYSEKELCLVTNMLYSDYCEVTRSYISPENEAMFYVKLAKAWLEDEDAPEGSEKLALYYHCVINSQD